MANAYLLNGTVSPIRVRVNTGDYIDLEALDFQTPSQKTTAKLGLASSRGPGILGLGSNEVLVAIGGITTKWNVELGPPVTIALDVQLIIFGNALQAKNTVGTEGFKITKMPSNEVAARGEGSESGETSETGESSLDAAGPPSNRRPPAVSGATSGELSFKFLAADAKGALYEASNNSSSGAGVTWTYYYLFAAGTPPPILKLQESWDQVGAYVFLNTLEDPHTLLAELATALSHQDTNFSRLAWRVSAGEYNVVQASTASAVAVEAKFVIGGWQLLLLRNTRLDLDTKAPGVRLIKASAEQTISVQFVRNQNPQPIGTRPQEILLPLDGLHRGTLTLAWIWDHYQLGNDLGGNLRVFYGADAESASVAQYPLFTPAADPGPFPQNNLPFFVYLQPLAPLDGSRTRLALDLDLPNALTSKYLSSTTNAPVSVKPAASSNGGLTAGFGFAKNTGLQESDRYLCPVGEFQVEAPGAADGSDRVQIRGGIAGTEYVLVEPGDRLSFENGRPAFAQGYQPQGGSPTQLDDALTTSWVRVIHKSTENAGQDGEVVDTSYCAQSSASTYFGAAADQSPYAYPIAVGASLVQFEAVKGDALFPMLPYGGVFFQDEEEGIENPNPDLSAKELGSIERQVVAPDRRDRLEPFFDETYGPIFFDTSTNIAFNGGFARTPLGLLAELNPVSGGDPPSGTVKRILLARSPQKPEQLLALDAGPKRVVNPQFTNTVLNDNLFLVATDANALEPFANQIKLGDFTFRIDLGNKPTAAIALFKFVPGVSARTLIDDSDAWDMLIGDGIPDEIQKRLQRYLRTADDGGELYADFRKMIDDPNWNGLLFFNVGLNYQALPLDIQILLGGIKGPLFAHHFGVTINQVADGGAGMSLDQSSLFSVINYEADFVPPPSPPLSWYPNFQVLLFNVRYANSKLAVFDSQIAFSIKDLFGSPVSLKKAAPLDKPASGTIVIDGVYTLFEDGTGSLVFSTKELRSFVYDVEGKLRVCEAQSVTGATLVPVAQSAGADGATIASSQFRLSGLLAFRNGIGGDLFSYGKVDNDVPVEGLAIGGYAFAMETTIKGDDATLSPIKTFLDALRVDQVLSKARDKSLKRTFPSAIQAVTITPSGLRPTKTGEWTVKVDGSDFKAAPVYSLTFNVPLGILGALLSTKTDLTAQLFVGWVPGKTATDEDKVGLVLRLPAQVAGPSGFQFEGIISSSFEYVQLNRFKFRSSTGGDDTSIYCLLFVHYQGFLCNLLFNYSIGPKDLGLFGGPSDPGGSNALFFVGKSVDSNWNGPQLSILLDGVPSFFLGRSYDIKTDPTNPNVISDVFDKLNVLSPKSVEEFAQLIFANASLYNSDAGIAFALKFKFKSLELIAVLHDSSFYGAQIKITPEKPKPPNGGGKLLTQGGTALVVTEEEEKKGFLDQIKDFTFTIIYRKVSDTVGVWSADIYLNLGQINVGAFQLSLPNFSISIWTNGDWRFAIGWPFEGPTATPITVQFQAGPFPIIAKCGFYLGKLSSAAAPEQFGTEFNLIWMFGLGIAAGVGKEWKSGPLKAGASLILGLQVQGFLASFSGKMTEDGVDYWWWGISLSLTGNVFGKVDFEIIVVDVSLTITITIAFAIETAHSSPLTMTAQVKVKASIKILFIKISFSFEMKLEIFSFTFGTGPVAKLSGPTPTAVLEAADELGIAVGPRQLSPELVREVRRRAAAVGARAAGLLAAPLVVTAQVPLSIGFVLQPTSVSKDAKSWAPQGVGTLVIASGDHSSQFGNLAAGLARWLIAAYGGSGTFEQQLEAVTVALQLGAFDTQVSLALSESFVFSIGRSALTEDTAVVGMPVHPTLRIDYGGSPIQAAADSVPRSSLGARRVPSNYFEMIDAYFSGRPAANALLAEADGDESTAGTIFNEFFVMLAQQLIQLLDETEAPDLEKALAELNLGDLGGFVSRFLMAGVRLPDPENPNTLEALYVLTGQQFALKQVDSKWLLESELVGTSLTPDWIKVQAGTKSSLEQSMVHTKGPSAPPWTLGQMRALEPGPVILPMNDNLGWEDSAGSSFVISRFSEKTTQAIRDWRRETGSTTGPWLAQKLVGGESDADQQVDLAKDGIPWKASASLLIPIRLAAIPDPSGQPGAILADIFSLMGTDEANRAALQALLNDPKVSVRAVDLLYSPSRGTWKSTKIPNVLVRTDLSTSNVAGVAAQTAVSEPDSPNCSNYAKLEQGGEQLMRFLRLVWEVSVVHSDGFYLQVENLDLQMFDQGPADLMLLVRFGASGSIVQATDYQNSLVGEAPEDGKAIFSTVASDAAGTPVEVWAAAYPGGSVGWSITWENAPDEADASSERFLEGLYQMVSYRVEKINGQPIATSWSRPVTAQDESPEQSSKTTWTYQKAFETAPVTGSANRYADVNDAFTVRISIEDVFGNTLPASMLPVVDLKVLYNDDILGLGDWVGTQAYYLITSTEGVAGGIELKLQLSLDTSVVTDSEGKIDPEQLARTTLLYQQLADQLTDPNMKAAADTGKVLAPAPLDKLTDGTTLLSGLSKFVTQIVEWLKAVALLKEGGPGDGPAPVTLSMNIVKSQPTQWPGDLQELVVTVILERTGVSDEIAKKAPDVRRVDSPVQPVEEPTSDEDPTGLTPFADNFERAYYPFDAKKGVIKVATGINNDLSSVRFGRRSIWLQRWGVDAGTAVKILNDDSTPPVFYAPPPLSTQLITRTVEGLRQYDPTNPNVWKDVSLVFSSTDMDQWAANFLATVETIFSPQMASAVAVQSTPSVELYDPFVDHKESLAGSISQKTEYIYDEAAGTGDPGSAKETWRQALLRTLENDYGFSALTQLKALVTLHGKIEPGGDPNNPPQLYGVVQVPGEAEDQKLPYSLTPTRLPLVEGTNWLNFLVSAQDPAAQRAFTLDLDYEVNQLEHLRDGAASACGYTPSSWLTFVLQRNPEPLPQGQENTLTQPIGSTRIPIPLRSYPPLPKLFATSATQNANIDQISKALTWNCAVTVERSSADQDSLTLSLSFNETETLETPSEAAVRLLATGRPEPKDLYAALARFVFEYPQLKPLIDELVVDGGPNSIQAVKEFSELIAGAALTWPKWQPPEAPKGGLLRADSASNLEVWNFEIQNKESSVNLMVKMSSSRGQNPLPWPAIKGYTKIEEKGDTATYQPDGGVSLTTLDLSWDNLYILDYQNVRPSAYTERNANLAEPPQQTNPAFVYRTETVTWPTPVVPLVSVGDLINLPSGASLKAAVAQMLTQLSTAPQGSRTNGTGKRLDIETSIDYRYQVLVHKDSSVFSLLPVFLLKTSVVPGNVEPTAAEIASNLALWRDKTKAESEAASLRFALTLFSTSIVDNQNPLPLVQFPGLVIPVPGDTGWW